MFCLKVSHPPISHHYANSVFFTSEPMRTIGANGGFENVAIGARTNRFLGDYFGEAFLNQRFDF